MEGIDPTGLAIFVFFLIMITYSVGIEISKKYRKSFPKKTTLNDVVYKYNKDKISIKESASIAGYPKEWIKRDFEELETAKTKRQLAFIKPETKERYIFHGGCLSCKTPLNKGIGECRECLYFMCNTKLTVLSTK